MVLLVPLDLLDLLDLLDPQEFKVFPDPLVGPDPKDPLE